MSAVLEEIGLDSDKLHELINGQLEEKEKAGARHGGIGMRLGSRLNLFVEENNLGGVYGPDTTFTIGENERMPDIAFITAERIPSTGEPEGKWHIAPDLAVEIISPTDIYEKVQEKIQDYFRAGVKQVWLVSTKFRTITIHHAPTKVTILTEEDELTCEELFPGFHLPLREVFKAPTYIKKDPQ